MDNPEVRTETDPGKGYALSGKIMLCAIIVLFAVVVFMVGLHLYARWYLVRLRRRQIERRRQRRGGRTHVVVYADSRNPNDHGLELAVINSLPYYLYSSKAAAEQQPPLECAVCLSEFEEKEIVRLLPKCNHNFHLDCIDMWFKSHSTCPLCRSGVEIVSDRLRPVAKPVGPVEEASRCEPAGSSSGAGLCATCCHEGGSGNGGGDTTSLGGRRKGLDLVGVRIEVPPRRTELDTELTQSSPASRLMSLKRILSMGMRSPAGGGGATTPSGAGTSGCAAELDLESGSVEIDDAWTYEGVYPFEYTSQRKRNLH
ncbi:hypothetical protein BUALT_Bualt14G0061300 [Buddleja alternifolia]|uniref:RING-type E3 ubiquitin transferase n=1 Tax=Buddleja alternifolia TaxID=168488 RepID=A0AAV6WH18_9LAMI|nr:hypothetical protein BUALT_Bualt14G0061300 [Buddleja alternifolia]